MIVATVTDFSGTSTPDKNGEMPVMLQCIAGTMPNRNVLSGTVARRAGFEVGKTYLVNVRESGYDQLFGADFTFTKVADLDNGLDIIRTAKEIGDPQIVRIPRPEGFEDTYQRKGDAIESQRTVRMKAGLYQPSVFTTVSEHSTAREVRKGSSVENGNSLISLNPEGEKLPGEEEGELQPVENTPRSEQRNQPQQGGGRVRGAMRGRQDTNDLSY